jgi:hypothetical protein
MTQENTSQNWLAIQGLGQLQWKCFICGLLIPALKAPSCGSMAAQERENQPLPRCLPRAFKLKADLEHHSSSSVVIQNEEHGIH